MPAINIQFILNTTGINFHTVPLHGAVSSALYRFKTFQLFLSLLQTENYLSCKVCYFKKLCGHNKAILQALVETDALNWSWECVLKMKSCELEHTVKTLVILNSLGPSESGEVSPLLV